MESTQPEEQIGSRSQSEYLSATDAIATLNIKPQTLYAYVARGWVRAIAQDGTRKKLYRREDIERLRARRQARAGHGPSAAGALRWGEPVINSSITELTPLGPRYRGTLATDIARKECAFEATADLLWSGVWNERTAFWPKHPPGADFNQAISGYVRNAQPEIVHNKLATLVHLLSEMQGGNAESSLGSTTAAARQMIHVVAGAFGMLTNNPFVCAKESESVAALVLRAMQIESDAHRINGLNAALTLAADHELALPSFAVRAVASSGANLNACVLTGLVSFDGPLTGIAGDSIEDLVFGCTTQAQLRDQILRTFKQGRQLVGFNHPLYPAGDPRAQLLVEMVRSLPVLPSAAHALLETLDAVTRNTHIALGFPTGLLALQLALGLPRRCGRALFLLGRIAGLVAHVQEQRLAAFFIRPRAKYVG